MKSKKNKIITLGIIILILGGCVLLGVGALLSIYYNRLIVEYQNKTYKNTYVNNYQFSNLNYEKVIEKLSAIEEEALNKTITFFNDKDEIQVKLADFDPTFNTLEVVEEMNNDIKNSSYVDKIRLINAQMIQQYNLKIYFDEDKVEKVLSEISTKLNRDVKKEQLIINEDHTVSFDNGYDGYEMDFNKTKAILLEYLKNMNTNLTSEAKEEYRLEVSGKVIPKENTNLSTINTKISTFSTDFDNYGNRGYNISLATSKLNNTLIQPQGIFSFRQVVGPYTCSNGYKIAPVQSASGYGCGGGVCQVSTTLYNAQLLAGLETIMRYNHSYAVSYVPKGQDATVGGDYVDYQFKNQYQYPIFIVAYIESNKVTIEIWSNDNALEGKSFAVVSQRVTSGGFETYLLTYKDNELINKKLLHTSFYYG